MNSWVKRVYLGASSLRPEWMKTVCIGSKPFMWNKFCDGRLDNKNTLIAGRDASGKCAFS